MKDRLRLLGYGFLWLGLLIVAVRTMVPLVQAIENNERAGDVATWFGSIGTVCAIFFSFVLAKRSLTADRRLQAERKLSDEIFRLSVVMAVFARTQAIAQLVADIVAEDDGVRLHEFDPAHLEDCKHSMNSLPLFDVPSADVAICLTGLPRAIDQFLGSVRTARSGLNEGDTAELEAWYACDAVDHLENLISALVDASDRCAGEIGLRRDELRAYQ